MVREVERLRESVKQLEEILFRYGIPAPSQSPYDTGNGARLPTAELLGQAAAPKARPGQPEKPGGSVAVVSLSDDPGRETGNATSNLALPHLSRTHVYPEDHTTGSMTQKSPWETPKNTASTEMGGARPQKPDLVAVAMEFVLTYDPSETRWQVSLKELHQNH